MSITIKEVKSAADLRRFIDYPHELYKDDPYYVPELFMSQKALLSPGKDPFYKHSKATKYLALRNGKIVGRIAAIRNNNHIDYCKRKEGFFGFFEVIEDYSVAEALFDRVVEWQRKEGLFTLLGPANPSTNDPIGLMVKGFTILPHL